MVESFPIIISLTLVVTGIIALKLVDKYSFKDLEGSHKAIGVIILIIVVVETIYLALSFNVLTYALETVTSLSVILLFFIFTYLNKLNNAAAGMSIALSSKFNVGDMIEINGKRGRILQVGLTKTIIDVEGESMKMIIPNKKFDEEPVMLSYSKKEFKDRFNIEDTSVLK